MNEKYSPSYAAMMPEVIGFELAENGCMEETHYATASVRFTVRGVGWATDFETIVRAPEWDDDKEKEE